MAETYKTEDGTGSKLIFTYPFPVLKTEDVKVALNGGIQAATKYTVSLSPAQITFNNTSIDSTLQENTGAPKSGVKVRVFRNTEVDNPKARFAAGNSVRAADLNNNVDQALYALQEEKDQPLWDVDFEGGTINGVTIGATTPATGRFTSLELTTDSQFQVSGNLIIGDSIDDDTVGFLAKCSSLIPAGSDSTLDNDGNVIPNSTINYSTSSLGDSHNKWKKLYIHDTAEINDLTVLGNVDLGNAATDSITPTGRFDAHIIPLTDGNIDLGADGVEFNDLYIDGTANIDSLVADTADINAGSIDGTTIGATTAAAGTFTNLTASNLDGTIIGATTRAAGKFTDLSVNGNIICDASLPKIRTATADGSDNKTLLISAGGDTSTSRGAVISLSGNEASGVGDVVISSGATTDGKITFSAGASSTLGLTVTKDGDVEIPNDLSVSGTLTVSGTTTTLNTSTIEVEDKNITLAKVSTPTDVTADGGGLTIKGATDKTFNWVNATDAFTSSEHIYLNADNRKLKFGAASGDASIYYDGSDLIAETNSVLVKTTSNQEFMVDDVVRFMINDGNDSVQTSWPIVPMQDGEHDLGTSSLEWRDLYIDGTAYLDAVDINDGNIDGTIIGANSAAAGTFTTGTITTADINGGNIDGTIIGATTAAAGTFTSGTFTSVNLLDDQKIKLGDAADDDAELYYSGNVFYIDSEKGIILDTGNGSFSVAVDGTTKLAYINGAGYVAGNWLPFADDTHSLGSDSYKWKNLKITGTASLPTVDIDAGNIDGTTIGANSAAAGTFTNLTVSNIDGAIIGATTAAAGTFTTGTITTADINGGNIDGTTIGATTAAAGTFTTGSFNDITLTDSAVCSITTNSTDGSDNKVLVIGGGGAETALRGGIAAFYGNESGSEGTVAISTGRTANAKITLTAGLDGTADLTVTKDGDVSLANHLTLPDDKKIKLGTDSTDYSEIYFTGNALTIKSDDDILIDADDALDIKSDSNQNFYVGETIRFQLHNTAEQITANWPIIPGADDTYDLGSESTQWQDIYIDGTAYLDSVDIDSGNIDGTTIGATTPVAGTFTTLKTSTTVGQISSNTDDGSDIKNLHLCGGGGTGNARGATISLSGNEATNAGNLYLYSGAVTTGEVFIYAGDSTTLGIKVNQHGNVVIPTDLTVQGTLNVTGTTTTINTTNLEIEDKNITLAKVSTPTDTTADGGGITIKGETDKTFNWVDATDAFTSSEHIHLNGDGRKLILGASSTDSEIYYQDNNFLRLKSAGSISLDTAAGNFLVADDGTVKFGWATAVGFYVDDDVKPLTTDSHDLGHSSLQWKDLYIDGVAYLDEVDIDAGAIDGTTIGANSAAAGTFTDIKLTGATINNITNATADDSDNQVLVIGGGGGGFASRGAIAAFYGNEVTSAPGDLLLYGGGTSTSKIKLHTGSSGTLGLVVDENQKVGIGTSSPDQILHVKTSVNNTAQLVVESTATDSYPLLKLKNDAKEYQLTCHGGLSDAFTIYDGTSGNHRFTISSDGKVGIGTTSPSSQLHVASGSSGATANSSSIATIESSASDYNILQFLSPNTAHQQIRFGDPQDDGAGFIDYDHGNSKLQIGVNGPTRLTIDSSGNASFEGSLTVNTGGTNVTSSFVSTDAYAWIQFKDNGTTDTAVMVGAQDDNLLLRAGSNERLRITSDGDVSISGDGSVHGVAKLTVLPTNRTTAFDASDGDTWHDVVLKQTGDAATNAVGIAFEVSANTYHKNAGTGIAAVKNGTDSDYGSDLVFITRPQSAAAAERLRITSSGNLGIGIATPDSKLHLEGSDDTAKIKFQRTGTTIGGSIQTRDESGDKGLTYIAKDGNSAVPNHVFQTDTGSGGVERLRITSSGNIKTPDNGKLVFGDGDDLSIWHGESNSGNGENANYINSASGRNIILQVQDDANGIIFHKRTGTGLLNFEPLASFTAGGAAKLFYDGGTAKFETTATGATINGTCNMTTLNCTGSGSTGANFTVGGNLTVTGSTTANGSAKILGASGADAYLYMYSNAQGSNSDCWRTAALHADKYLYIQNYTDAAWETNALFKGSDGVELYYDNSKKFSTNSEGVKVESSSWTTVDIVAATNDAVLRLQNEAGIAHSWTIRNDFSENNDLVFRYNNSRKLDLDSSGNLTVVGNLDMGNNDKILLGNGDELEIYFDGSHSKLVHTPNTGNAYLASDSLILSTTDMSEYYLTATANGAVELYHGMGSSANASKKLETTSTGVQVTGRIDILGTGTRIDIANSGKIILGDDNDLQIFHDGTNNVFDHVAGSSTRFMHGNEKMLVMTPDSHVELYYDGSGTPKFETTPDGAKVSGRLDIESDGTHIKSNQLEFNPAGTAYIDHATTGQSIVFRTSSSSSLDTTALTIASNGTLSANTTSSTSTQNAANGTAYTAAIVADGSTGGSGTSRQGAIAINNCGTTSAWGIIAKPASGLSISVLGAWFDEGGDTCGSIYIGDSGTSYNTSSDYRIKENAVDISDGITRLKQLKPYKFNFKKVPSKTVDGFFAHEAQTVVPEAVTGTKDEVDSDGKAVIQGIDQSKLVPLLTAALQEAIAKIEVLETKVAALEAG